MSDNQTNTIVEHASALTFSETVNHLAQAIEKAGMTIFARIDHARNAINVGILMPPTTVLIYGNAKGGTPIMLANPLAALDLPLRVLIRETEGGKPSVAFHPVKAMLSQAGVPDDMAARLEPTQALLLTAVTQ